MLRSIDEKLRNDIISLAIANGITGILDKCVFNSHFYLDSEMNDFYRDVIKPLRDNQGT